MPPPHLTRDVVTVLALVGANAYFVATEFAMVRIRATQLRPLVKRGDWRARIAYRVTQNLDRFISAVQLGVTFTSLGLGWVGEALVGGAVAPYLTPFGEHHAAAVRVISFLSAFGVTASLHIVLGELVPKTIAIQRPRTVTLWFTPPLLLFYYVFFPLIWVLKTAANLILRLLGFTGGIQEEEAFSPEELHHVLASSSRSHPSDVLINKIMIKALRLKETTAEHVMVPRDSTTVLWRDEPLDQNLIAAQRGGYSRMPVCGATKDDVLGIVMVKELLWQYSVLGAQTDLNPLIRPALTFLPKTKLPTMLEPFRKSRNHLAVVLDADDRMLGIVTFEDVLEELVGDIRDEFDIEKGPFYELSENSALVDANLALRDLAIETGWPLPTDTTKTVRKWCVEQFGHPPAKREETESLGFHLIAEEVSAQGLRRVRIFRLEPKPGEKEEEEMV